MKTIAAFLSIVLTSSFAFAHTGARIWVDLTPDGKLVTLGGPAGGGAPGSYSPGDFHPERVFSRDMGNPGDDDVTENYVTNFPGYERTPFPSSAFSGDVGFDITGEPLYYQSGAFVPVSTAFATDTPFFRIEDPNHAIFTTTTGFVPGGKAFTAGSHGHPLYALFPVADLASNGPDQYDGIYALPLRLNLTSADPSETFYLLLGRNASGADLLAAENAMRATLVPEPGSLSLLATAGLAMIRRRPRRK